MKKFWISVIMMLTTCTLYAQWEFNPKLSKSVHQSHLNNYSKIKLTPEQQAEALEFWREIDPQGVDELARTHIEKPMQSHTRIVKLYRSMKVVQRYEKEDPVRAERLVRIQTLEAKSRHISKSLRSGEGNQDELKNDMLIILNELFNLKQVEMSKKVSEMEDSLRRLKQRVEEREQNKEMIIQRRLQELEHGFQELEW